VKILPHYNCTETHSFQGYVGIDESWEATSAKRNSARKSALTEIDHYTLRTIVSKNHRTTAAQATAEPNIHVEDTLSTKRGRRDLHKFNIRGRVATAKPLIIDSNAQMRKRWRHDHKTWTSDSWKLAPDMVR
jgi:hypothetical protein